MGGSGGGGGGAQHVYLFSTDKVLNFVCFYKENPPE